MTAVPLYKKMKPFGTVIINNRQYTLLAPSPVVGDSWQRDNQQRWLATKEDWDLPSVKTDVSSLEKIAYNQPFHVIGSTQNTVVEYRDKEEIYVDTGEYIETESAAYEIEYEPTPEDLDTTLQYEDDFMGCEDVELEVGDRILAELDEKFSSPQEYKILEIVMGMAKLQDLYGYVGWHKLDEIKISVKLSKEKKSE